MRFSKIGAFLSVKEAAAWPNALPIVQARADQKQRGISVFRRAEGAWTLVQYVRPGCPTPACPCSWIFVGQADGLNLYKCPRCGTTRSTPVL